MQLEFPELLAALETAARDLTISGLASSRPAHSYRHSTIVCHASGRFINREHRSVRLM